VRKMLQQNSLTQASTETASSTVQAFFAIILGVFIVGFAGFWNIDAVHNAAHDMRHASGFPCH